MSPTRSVNTYVNVFVGRSIHVKRNIFRDAERQKWTDSAVSKHTGKAQRCLVFWNQLLSIGQYKLAPIKLKKEGNSSQLSFELAKAAVLRVTIRWNCLFFLIL